VTQAATDTKTIVIVGGTSGIGLELAKRRVAAGDDVVITGRDGDRCGSVAAEIGAQCRGLAVELSDPAAIAAALDGVGTVDHLVVAAIDRDQNTAADYDVGRAVRLVTLKLVGYTEVVHALLPRMAPDGAVVLFGGLAKDRPYPGSTTVSTINGGVMGLVHTLAVELAPLRVNAVHPGIVGDSPFWQAKPPGVLDGYISRTPIGRLATMADVADAVDFLLRNRAMNGVNLNVDGGWLLT
jgi:NAD(P)-dependent dehydrogenase (short-subunit alcohol dehydrogenase family)